jgi:hypothetical protein
MVAAAPVLPVGYVVSASRIADRRMILTGYRLADLLSGLLGVGSRIFLAHLYDPEAQVNGLSTHAVIVFQ